jgi:acyl-CoA reductase-like NAD-dependent aldehyde dehydrogenase
MGMKTLRVGPIIDGKELHNGEAGSCCVVNPATGQTVATQELCDEACVARIVESSTRAYQSSEWQKLSAAERGYLLLNLASLVEKHAEELIELELMDTGKPITQLRTGEIPLAAAIIRFYAGAADKIEGSIKSGNRDDLLLTFHEPYGVVAGILPWNYPFVNATMKTAPALAAGNAIVLKPSVETPLATVAFAKLCLKAGLPPGIVNVVLGGGAKAGNALVTHPAVKKVSFTGSTQVGCSLQRLAADQMKAINLECGGKNALIVLADADLDRAADAALLSGFANAGQLCVSCSRVLVQASVARRFETMLADRVAKLKVGDPRHPKTLIGPMITRGQHETVQRYLDEARREGGTVLCGGSALKLPKPFDQGFWIQPTLLTCVKPGMKAHDEEIFGPVLSVTRFRNEAEALSIANNVPYGLSGSVWTSDVARGLRLAKAMDTGIIWVNSMLTGYPQIPVPPHKMSGTGVELGMEGLLAYLKRKSVVLGVNDRAPVGWKLD